jgi:hypothetical protein
MSSSSHRPGIASRELGSLGAVLLSQIESALENGITGKARTAIDEVGSDAKTATVDAELEAQQAPEGARQRALYCGPLGGASASANRLKDVHEAPSDYTSGRTDSPFPLMNCPWCGEAIKIQNIKLVDIEGKPTKKNFARAAGYCDKSNCLYTESKAPGLGLPGLFVDEQIYQEVPSFIVATVDKFAMTPWRGDAGMLFGRATHVDEQLLN